MNPPLVCIRLLLALGVALAGVACDGPGFTRVPQQEPDFGPQPEPIPDFEPDGPPPPLLCSEPEDCGSGGECNGGICDFGGGCDEDPDCGTFLCVEDTCAPCSDAFACNTGICTDGVCAPPPDFEYEVEPLLTASNCVVCHQSQNPPVPLDLVFDVGAEAIFQQVLDPEAGRVNFMEPATSTILTKPLREDPPDHPVGLWNRGGPEEEVIVAWIAGGAPRISECRAVFAGSLPVDCYEASQPANICTALVDANNNVRTSAVEACRACSVQFASLGAAVQACVDNIDGGVVVVDGGAVVVDGGIVVVDGGIVDGGIVDGGIVDGGVVDAGPPDGGTADGGTVDADAGTLLDAGTLDAGETGTPDAG